MALHKVPGGNKNYRANDEGFREIGMSVKMAAAMAEVGRDIAAKANAKGKSEYDSNVTTVYAGRELEKRQGVSVHETTRNDNDWYKRVLLGTTENMQVRTGKK